MNNYNCETCNGKGWIKTTIYNSTKIFDGALIIEKCDDCQIFIDDISAAKFAYQNYKILSFSTTSKVKIKANFSLN